MKKTILALLAAIALAVTASAQIPAEVSDVMNRCRAAMNNPGGLEYEMDMRAGVGPLALKMHLTKATKGNLTRSSMSMKFMGVDILSESGFDGSDTWNVKHTESVDSITITHGDTRAKEKNDLALDLDSKYRKAKMKTKDGYFEITFSDPVDKANEAKSITIKISSKNYTVREVHTSARGAKVTMTVTKIRVGLSDSHFKLNLAKYPNAVVIRQ